MLSWGSKNRISEQMASRYFKQSLWRPKWIGNCYSSEEASGSSLTAMFSSLIESLVNESDERNLESTFLDFFIIE